MNLSMAADGPRQPAAASQQLGLDVGEIFFPRRRLLREEGGSASSEPWPGRANPARCRQYCRARRRVGCIPPPAWVCMQACTPGGVMPVNSCLWRHACMLHTRAIAANVPAAGVWQRAEVHAGRFGPLQRKGVRAAFGTATLGPRGRASNPGLQVSPGHVSVPGSSQRPAHSQPLLWERTGMCWEPAIPGERRFAGLGLSWRGSAEEGGLGAGGYCPGVRELLFLLSPPPTCKESFILNPFPLLAPPELALRWNGLILKREK